MDSFYDLLGISKEASGKQIKAAYKRKAIQYHPDKNNGDPEMEELFKKVNAAYQILSDPYAKSTYDMRLEYGSVTFRTDKPPRANPPTYHYDYAKRPYRVYPKQEIDWKENWKATLYAFAFTFVIALLVVITIGLRDAYNEKQFFENLENRKSIFYDATELKAEGQLEAALSKLSTLNDFILPYEKPMQDYRNSVFLSLTEKGNTLFNNADYSEALIYFDLLEKYTNLSEIELLTRQARAYRLTNQPEKALKVLTKILLIGHKTSAVYVEMAEIQNEMMNDPMTALELYESANDYAKKYYEIFYGKAYAIVLDGRDLPKSHYRLYLGLAKLYLTIDRPDKALSASKWNTRVWPDSSENYLINARAYRLLGKSTLACENYNLALAKGAITTDDFCN
jgi:curved DNA-binding protein CbpA